MTDLVKAVKAVTIGVVFVFGIIYGGWIAILVEGIIALVYIICKVIE